MSHSDLVIRISLERSLADRASGKEKILGMMSEALPDILSLLFAKLVPGSSQADDFSDQGIADPGTSSTSTPGPEDPKAQPNQHSNEEEGA